MHRQQKESRLTKTPPTIYLEHTISTIPKQDMFILLGHFNAKLGGRLAFLPHMENHKSPRYFKWSNNLMDISTMIEQKHTQRDVSLK